jgi:hypothetical protein
MKDRKAGMKDNPLFIKTEKAKGTNASGLEENIQTHIQTHIQARLQRRTFYLEDEVFEMLRRFSFEKREKMYKVVNEALKAYIKEKS